MVASNTSKRWEESNLFGNYWFPFGFYHLLRNFLYVNSCLCGFDHFGPHPAIASDQPFCLELPNPCELIGKPQTQPFSPLRQNPLTDVTGSFISGLRGAFFIFFFHLLIFSQIWTHIKGAIRHSKKVWKMWHPVFMPANQRWEEVGGWSMGWHGRSSRSGLQ